MRRFLFLGLYLSFITVLMAAAGEVAVQGLGIAPAFDDPDGDYVTDPYLPFKPKANLLTVVSSSEFSHEVHHNSLGFRDEEHAVEKAPNTFRILALGDSFTYGYGARYEDTYLVVLEKLLNQRRNNHANLEIIKMGVPMYFPEAERLLLQHYGMKYSPDLILVAFVPNDVIDTSQGIGGVVVSPKGILISSEAASLGNLGMWFYKYSHLGRLVLNRLIPRVTSLRHPSRWNDVYIENGFHENDWRKVEVEYEKMLVLAREISAKLVLINIPQNGDLLVNLQLGYPGRRLASFAARHGIDFIDTLPAMADAMAKSKKPLYWPRDGHCTEEGYHVIGQTIYRELMQKGLVGNRTHGPKQDGAIQEEGFSKVEISDVDAPIMFPS